MSDEVAPGFVRVRLDLAYDGTDFSGWAKQRGRRTVQGELEARAARRCCGCRTGRADGRRAAPTPGCTPAARSRTSTCRRRCGPSTASKLLRRLAGRLPRDVRVWRVAEAPGRLQRALLGDLAALRLPGRRPPRRGRPAAARARAVARPAAGRGRDERGRARSCSGSTTSPRTARSARARRPSAPCWSCSWERDGRRGWSWRPCGPTPSATTWCARWSGAMLLVGDGHRPVGFPGGGAGRAGAALGGQRGAPARADPGGGRLPGGRPAGRAQPGGPQHADAAAAAPVRGGAAGPWAPGRGAPRRQVRLADGFPLPMCGHGHTGVARGGTRAPVVPAVAAEGFLEPSCGGGPVPSPVGERARRGARTARGGTGSRLPAVCGALWRASLEGSTWRAAAGVRVVFPPLAVRGRRVGRRPRSWGGRAGGRGGWGQPASEAVAASAWSLPRCTMRLKA